MDSLHPGEWQINSQTPAAWTPIESLTLRDRNTKHPNGLEHSNQHQMERGGGQETGRQPVCFLSSHYTLQVSYFSSVILNTNRWHLLSVPIHFKVIPPLDVYKLSNYFTCFLEKIGAALQPKIGIFFEKQLRYALLFLNSY